VSNKPHGSNLVELNLFNLGIEKNKVMIIQSLAKRIGEQVGQTVSDLVVEVMALVLSGKSPSAVQSPLPAFSPRDRLLNANKVASFLNITKAKAYRMMQDCEIPIIRMGRTARVRAQDLEAFIKNHVIQA